MHLGTARQWARRDVVGEIADLGSRLEHIVSRYERLVRELNDVGTQSVTELEARVRMANRDLSAIANQLQQVLVEKRDEFGVVLTFDAAAATPRPA